MECPRWSSNPAKDIGPVLGARASHRGGTSRECPAHQNNRECPWPFFLEGAMGSASPSWCESTGVERAPLVFENAPPVRHSRRSLFRSQRMAKGMKRILRKKRREPDPGAGNLGPRPGPHDLAIRFAERDARETLDDRTPAEKWLGDPISWLSARAHSAPTEDDLGAAYLFALIVCERLGRLGYD